MRIGIFTPYLDTLSGGEKYVLSVAVALAKQHTVSVFWNPSEKDKITQKAKSKLGINLGGIEFKENIFSKNTSFLSRFLASRSYDLIFLLSDGSLPFLGTKTFVHFQFPVEWIPVSLKTRMKVKRIAKIICNSYFTKHYIDKKLSTKSFVLYPPVRIGDPDMKQKENILLHVGRYGIVHTGSSYKKQEAMVEAFKKISKTKIKGWKLVFVVSVDSEDMLKDIKEQAEGFSIEFVVNPSNEILWRWYQKAKIYWHASGFGEDLEKYPDRAEHFGISTVEAMGMGAVPIVINAGGQKEIVENNKNGLLWNSLEELVDLTQRVITDEEFWKKLSDGARRKAKDFSVERFNKEVLEMVNE